MLIALTCLTVLCLFIHTSMNAVGDTAKFTKKCWCAVK